MLLLEELEAVRFGLNLAWNLKLKHINLQIESMVVVQWLTHYGVYVPQLYVLINEYRSLITRE